MAGLGCGTYELSNNLDQNKSYLHVKLTDSAFNAIEDYIRIRNTATKPKIAFKTNNEGEIQIPGSRNNGTTIFSFSLQSIPDQKRPQGSFEFIKASGNKVLASLGPMFGKLQIQAKDDSYNNARISMEKVNQKNAMKCVKEVKSNSDNPYVRNRGMKKPTPAASKVSTPVIDSSSSEVHSNNRFNSSNSPHRTHHSGTIGAPPPSRPRPPPPPSDTDVKICNPDLVKKPLRERVIQLLAIKGFRKPQLMDRLRAEGLKEKDKRQMMSVITSVSQVGGNIHHLSKHLWSEVKDDWPFYTEEEKEAVRRNRPPGMTPAVNDKGHSPLSTPSLSPVTVSQGVKRTHEKLTHEENFDPTSKRVCRPRAWRSGVKAESEKRDSSSSQKNHHKPEVKANHLTNGHHYHSGESRHGMNGKISPGSNSLSNPSTSPIIQNSPRHHRINGTFNSGTHSPINPLPNGHTNGHNSPHETNGHVKVGQSALSVSPDSPEEPDYLRNYTVIVSQDQRSQYKADFQRDYIEYHALHKYVERRTKMFTELDERLRNEIAGSEGYNTIREQIIQEYNATQLDTDFQRKRKLYNYLHEKLTHIKRLVRDHDRDHS